MLGVLGVLGGYPDRLCFSAGSAGSAVIPKDVVFSAGSAGSAVMLLGITGMVVRQRAVPQPLQVAFSDLLRDVDRGEVTEVTVSGDRLDIIRADGGTARTMAPAKPPAISARSSSASEPPGAF